MDQVLKRLPTYAKAWSKEGLNQLMQYIETDRAGIEAKIVAVGSGCMGPGGRNGHSMGQYSAC